jgi:hypothetical protein
LARRKLSLLSEGLFTLYLLTTSIHPYREKQRRKKSIDYVELDLTSLSCLVLK